jgi:hypothetical protein
MIGNFFKIIATLVIGYFVGWIFGAMLGAFLGAIPSLFFREIFDSHQAVSMSISLSLLLGGILGFFATRMANKVFEANDKSFAGVAMGLVTGLLVVFFKDGVIGFSNTVTFRQSFYILPLIYSARVGDDTGSIIFSILGVTRVLRDIIETYKEAGDQKERLEGIKMSLGMPSSNKEKRG